MRKPLILLLCLVGLTLSACSSAPPAAAPLTPASQLGPTEALIASRAATNSVADLTVDGTIGYADEATTYALRRGGEKAEGVVGEGASQFTVITVPGFVFVKAPQAIWADYLKPAQAEQVDNKWVVSNAEGPLSDFAQFTDVSRLFRSSGNVTKGKNETVDGQNAITLIDPPTSTDSKWWIAAEGTPLLLKMQSADFTRLGFDYEQINIIDLPAQSDVIDFTLVLENRLPGQTPAPAETPTE